MARWFHFEGAEICGNSLSTALTPDEWELIDNQTGRRLKPNTYWYFQFFVDMAGATTFCQIADDAGWCLPAKPYPQVPDLPERGQRLRARCRWLFLVFHLAWLRLPGWVLRGDRGCIVPENGDFASINWDVFYSALPIDPFQAAVEAIDILTADTAPAVNRGGAAQPGEPGAHKTIWLTVSDAAKAAGCLAAYISRAVDAGALKSNGEKRKKRRIDGASLALWQLQRAKSEDAGESAEAVERKMKRAQGQ
jgi:hypothetical protein